MAELWEIARDKRKKLGGRPPIFETPDDLFEAANAYFEWATANPITQDKIVMSQGQPCHEDLEIKRPFLQAGFYVHSGCTESSFNDYSKRDGFSEVTAWIKSVMRDQCVSGAAAGTYKENIISRLLNIKETTATEITGAIATTQLSDDEYQAELKRMGIGRGSSQLGDKQE